MPEPIDDGIEVHHHKERGCLELSCEPGAFEEYRRLLRQQLADFPELEIDKVRELHITDAAEYVAARSSAWGRAVDLLLFLGLIIIPATSVVGIIEVVSWFVAN